jgi:hypothetical protein
MILQDRDVNVRDERVRQKDQTVIARRDARPLLVGTQLQGIESLSIQSHKLEPHMRVIVVMAELSNSFGEGTTEVRHVEHATAIG